MNTTSIFFNHSFDKKKLKAFIFWVLKTFGEKDALLIVEELKRMGFDNATKAGLSIGLHDLKTPLKKRSLISLAEITMNKTDQEFQGAEVTATERSQRIIDTWHRTSEDLRKQVVDYFSTYDQLNSVYMMALSGARGNFSQVRQLIGMRGLMADPQGQIISFPIRSNLREGLTLTEYFISCSGARKGLVDTALRTADTGYLTRRLVDISHHIVIKKVTCYTSRGIALKTLRTSQKILLPLKDRLVGRVLGETIYDELATQANRDQNSASAFVCKNESFEEAVQNLLNPKSKFLYASQAHTSSLGTSSTKVKKIIARRNQEISPDLAFQISSIKENSLHSNHTQRKSFLRSPSVLVRSPLTCAYTHELCQLCYGWSMAQGSLVSLGEAVGVIAGQSIGEPGTQLTMRTFHTGGVFSGDLLQEIRAPHSGKISFPKALQGLLIRTSQGKIAFLIKVSGELVIDSGNLDSKVEHSRKKDLLSYPSSAQQNAILGIEPHRARENESSAQTKAVCVKPKLLDDSQKNRSRQITRLPLEPSTILFVRQGEKVKSNQILAELAITSEEGNQPIQSRQTLFSERRGRVIQWKSMLSKIHRTKGACKNEVFTSKRRNLGDTQRIDSPQFAGSRVTVTESSTQKKQSIKAHLGPVESTLTPFERRNSFYVTLGRLRSYNQGSFVEPNLLETRNVQDYEQMWGNLKSLTVKQVVLSKRHGLGSTEPPKALQLGLLSVIATQIGASEKTCTKGITHNKLKFEQDVYLKSTLFKREKVSETNKKSNQYHFYKDQRSNQTSFPFISNFYPPHIQSLNKSSTFVQPDLVSKSKNSYLLWDKYRSFFDAKRVQRLPDLNTHLTGLQHLNTIAESGDLVDKEYTQL